MVAGKLGLADVQMSVKSDAWKNHPAPEKKSQSIP